MLIRWVRVSSRIIRGASESIRGAIATNLLSVDDVLRSVISSESQSVLFVIDPKDILRIIAIAKSSFWTGVHCAESSIVSAMRLGRSLGIASHH